MLRFPGAAKVFGRQGQNFYRQTRNQVPVLRRLISREIAHAMRRESLKLYV